MPTNTGMSPAGAADGAFERFLTAAIATIITIMFSWRLLTEEEEAAARAQGMSPPFTAPIQFKSKEDPNSSNKKEDQPECEISSVSPGTPSNVYSTKRSQSTAVDRTDTGPVVNERVEPAHRLHLQAINSPVNADDLSFQSENEDSLTDETLTTWDEYKWEEETGEEEKVVIKTRRNVRDFVTSPKSLSNSHNSPDTTSKINVEVNDEHASSSTTDLSPSNTHVSPSANSTSSPVLTFAQRFANFEYKDNGGDSGYIDLYPDVDSDDSDSSDDEHVYEIQVSDSDSDSPDDSSGRFYGMKSLDTIFEDDESDVSDSCDKDIGECDNQLAGADIVEGSNMYGSSDPQNTLTRHTETVIPLAANCHSKEENNIERSDHIDPVYSLAQNSSNSAHMQQVGVPLTQTEIESQSLKETNKNVLSTPQPLKSYVPTAEFKSDVNNSSLSDKDLLLQNNNTVSKPPVVSGDNGSDDREGENCNQPSAFRIELAKLQHKMKPLKSKQSEDEYNISELSDDSLPSSPIRTSALNTMGDDAFSDNESCSSESVITVVSVKSSDDDSYVPDRYEVTRGSNIPSATREENTSGDHLSLLNVISDDNSTQDSNSLVSGFLNDSLNSLLSANTDTESDFDYDGNKDNRSPTVLSTEEINGENIPRDNVIDIPGEQREIVIQDAQGQSLIQPQSVNEVEVMNGHEDITNDKKYDDMDNIPEQTHLEWQNDTTNLGSDSSSDSSDPPLREYDPDEDDLAAFQFNLDSDDDSFYLVVGDEGNLRNFDTFTNLNSIGLSPEYGDAVTSQTVSDDASGFKFSQTQEIDTRFRKRSYFTDRCNLSDSDTRSNPLSPIISEDEESRTSDKQTTELSEPDESGTESRLSSASAYSDAELSNTTLITESITDTKQSEHGNIDFQKYIIYSENSAPQVSAPNQDKTEVCSDHKDTPTIDKDAERSNNASGTLIDLTGVKKDISSVEDINNKRDRNVENETVTSLTEKIRNLSANDDESVDYGADNVLNENSVSSDRVNHEPTSDDAEYQHACANVRCDEQDKSKTKEAKFVPPDIESNQGQDQQIEEIYGKHQTKQHQSVPLVDDNSIENVSHAILKRETNIDDIFNEETENSDSSLPVNAYVKTTDISKSKLSRSDIRQRVSEPKTNVRTHSKLETNIDDIFVADAICEHKEQKLTDKNRIKTDTNVDDILISDSSYTLASDGPSLHHKHSTGTVVEDICDPVCSDSNKLPCADIQITENDSDVVSYETFVDDLLDTQFSAESESVRFVKAETNQNNLTSESVGLETSSDHPLQSTNTVSVNEQNELNNFVVLTVKSETAPCAHKKETNAQIGSCTNNNKNSELSTDNAGTTGDDRVHTDKDKTITVLLHSGSLNDNSQPEQSIHVQNQPLVTSYRVKPQLSPITNTAGTKVCDQNNSQTPDNITDRRNSPDNSPISKEDLKQNKAEIYDKTESNEVIITPVNASTVSRQWDHSSSTASSQEKHKDHNANVALAVDTFSNIAKHNNSKLGISPTQNNKNNYTSSDISFSKQPARDISWNKEHGNAEDNHIPSDKVDLRINDALKTSVQSTDISDSLESSSLVSGDEDSLSSIEDSLNSLQSSYNTYRLRGLSESEATGRVVRASITKPSDFFGKSKEFKGVKKKIHKHQLKKYTSILQQPIDTENKYAPVHSPAPPPPISRLKITQSRMRFLSAENLSTSGFEDKFLQHRTSLVTSTPRKYLKRHERSLTDLDSTESLPANMSSVSYMSPGYGSNRSMDRITQDQSQAHFQSMYESRYSSANTSYERADYDKLHANCIFSPQKREEIRHTTKSLENMFEQLLRYGSVSSLETDIDAEDTSHGQSLHDTDIIDYVSFQYPLERAASMSALNGSSDTGRMPRRPGKGRFANRLVPKSKSLQTLETNLDDVFAQENELSGELKKTPSVHELRVSKSLSKLSVPDWFKKSSFSRSGSTQSLFTYAGRQSSTSTLGSCAYPPSGPSSPSPSVTPGSNAVIIQKRVTPSPTTPSARLLRAPLLPTTPEKSPIHATPSTSLPSDRFRKNDKKELKPIAIVPFAKLREMFEKKSVESTTSPVSSPTKEKPAKVKFEPKSPTKESNPIHSVSKETDIDTSVERNASVQNHRTISPPPPIPERKPIIADRVAKSENVPQQNAQPRRTQVHFSDEQNVSRSQEQNKNSVRHNGAAPSESSTIKKPQSLRTSLPMPQFRFRRPGMFATKASSSVPQNTSTQSKKGKECNDRGTDVCDSTETVDASFAWLHALEMKAKYDGETLFEFLQKRRYSSLLENGFAEQMEELQDREVAFNFPVLSLGKHSNHGIGPMDRSPDLQVILTNACSNQIQRDYLNNKLRREAPVDDILDGLLLLNGHSTGRMKLDENGCIVPKHGEDGFYSPDTPPGMALNLESLEQDDRCNGCVQNENFDLYCDYTLVKCENNECNRETNLREAKKYFKTCHNCYSYYCSRSCRKEHWEAHKKICVYSRISSACKHVIKYINRQPQLQYQCSRIARRGYLSQGRGCVIFAFPDISSSEDFLSYGMDSLWVPPVYISLKELPHSSMLGNQLELLTDTCKQYNPELKYVIHVAIVIPPKLPFKPVPRRMDSIIQKCAKLRLSPAHMHPKQDSSDIPSTLILTAVPGNQHISDVDGRKTRELCFINIQRKLRNRGVSLRHHFPEVYNRLIDFVDNAVHFSPMIIYPIDSRSRKKFMCVIMPEAEPEIEWIRDPNLFHELDVFDEDEAEMSTPNVSHHELHEVLL